MVSINSELQNHTIGILGFGQEGQAVLKYLVKHGLSAIVYDESSNQSVNAMSSGASKFISGTSYLDTIGECTILFRSPGIWRKHPKILAAESAGVEITSQTKWFFNYSPAVIVGVTGTKGKGTTSSLIFEVLKASGKAANESVFLTGNIGKIQPLDFIDQTTSDSIVVYELSSFQLQDLTASPHIGICLMTTSDHLNHHEDLDEYHTAKSAITSFQNPDDVAIFNADYMASAKIGGLGDGRKKPISTSEQLGHGAYISGDKIIMGDSQIDCSARKLRGIHNLENIAAAALAATELNIEFPIIEKAVNDFTGLEHRLQFVGEQNRVGYYNDSISTVPETTLAAVNSFTEPIHLLLGGSDKGLDYSNLITSLLSKKNITSITLLGEIGGDLQKAFSKANCPIPTFGPYTDLSLAMYDIKQRATPGDIVLLSPAAASFDMFKNYADRGNQFVALVNQIN